MKTERCDIEHSEATCGMKLDLAAKELREGAEERARVTTVTNIAKPSKSPSQTTPHNHSTTHPI